MKFGEKKKKKEREEKVNTETNLEAELYFFSPAVQSCGTIIIIHHPYSQYVV